MNTFLEHRYREAKSRYLSQCAYMHESHLKWVETKGGKDALTGADLARHRGVEGRLIDLVGYNDAVEDYLNSLRATLDETLVERNRLRADLAELTGERPLPPPIPYREWLAMTVLGSKTPVWLGALLNAKEARRFATETTLFQQMPGLYSECYYASDPDLLIEK